MTPAALQILLFVLAVLPDKIDSDNVPVYRNRPAPVGIVYRKRSIDDGHGC